jgi:UDP-glucose 4-epimerase
MKIGITGGAGFIGGHVVDVALERGHDVVVFDTRGRLAEDETENFSYPRPMVTVERRLGDVRDATAMTELAAHTDGIIHLAACLGTQETITNPRPAAETNIVGGLNFLEACIQYGIPGVYIGVGNHWMENTYSITKTTVERFVRMFNAERVVPGSQHSAGPDRLGARFNTVRLVNAYGARQSMAPPFGPAKVRKILPSFIGRALTGRQIEVYGDGSQISDMVHVRDGALALVKALENADAGVVFDRAVEVGPATSNTVLEVAQMVRTAARMINGNHSEITFLPMRPGETIGTPVTADTSTLEFVDMAPEKLTETRPGIYNTVRWYSDNWLPGFLDIERRGGVYIQ